MIITDKGVRAAGLLDTVLTAFDEGGMDVTVIYDDVPADSSNRRSRPLPRNTAARNAMPSWRSAGARPSTRPRRSTSWSQRAATTLPKYSGAGVLTRPLKPFIVIPTTAGTGSEVTSVAVIADTEKEVKLAFASSFMLPDAAILDPRMTLTLPPHVTAATGMDAMTHSVEAFTCMAKNPLSDAYASAAIKKVSANLPKVMKKPDDAEARLKWPRPPPWPESPSPTPWSVWCMRLVTHWVPSATCLTASA